MAEIGRSGFRWSWGRFLPPVLLMAALFLVSHTPLPVTLPGRSDKFLHALAFGVLAVLWARALGFERRALLLAFLFSVLWGILDEFHQSFVPGRFASIGDAAADAVGALVAVVLLGVYQIRTGRGSMTV